MTTNRKIIWITWENHRRSVELAKALGVKLYKITYDGNKFIRSFILTLKSIAILVKTRPEIVIVQNPSVQLAYIACILKKILDYEVIVDRHSNFDFSDTETGIFNYLSNYSIRKAKLTIVTNQFLKDLVERKGGRGFILQDKLPTLNLNQCVALKGKINIVFVCTYSPDEPVSEVIEAGRHLSDDICIYITGNHKKLSKQVIENAPRNIVFTGYLAEEDYQSLLYSADILLVLTTREHTLLCGAYEGLSLFKPLIISNKDALKNYFYKGVVLTENDSLSIKNAILTAINKYNVLKKEIEELRDELQQNWENKFKNLKSLINNFQDKKYLYE